MEKNGLKLIGKYRSAIMGFATIWVLVFHAWIPIFEGGSDVVKYSEYFIKRLGYSGVDIFFFLSGIGLTYSFSKWQGYLDFYKRRLTRILPPYLTFSIFSAIGKKWSLITYIKKVLGYGFFFTYLMDFLWFVIAILIFYLFFPFYYKFLMKSKSQVLVTIGTIGLWYLVSSLQIIRTDLYGFTNRIPVFLIGILVGFLAQNRDFLFTKWSYLSFFIILVIGLYTGYLATIKGVEFLVPDSSSFFPPLMITLGISFLLPKLMDFLVNNRFKVISGVGNGMNCFLTFWGKLSLEVYCFQHLFYEFMFTLPPSVPKIVRNLYVLSASLITSWLFSFLWKSCCDKLKYIFQTKHDASRKY